jgi:intracellular septation protein A
LRSADSLIVRIAAAASRAQAMPNRLLVRGLLLITIALCFGVPAATYHVGDFFHAGPGLFPLLVSCIVAAIGLLMVVQSRIEKAESLVIGFKNIAIVLAGLVGFVVIADHLKAIPAIVYLVFVSTLAGTDYSVRRNLMICAVLVAIAFAFSALLGLNLPLI